MENTHINDNGTVGAIANSGRNEIYHFGFQTETENVSDIQPWAQPTVWTLLIDTTQCAELRELRPSGLACASHQRVNQSRGLAGAHKDAALTETLPGVLLEKFICFDAGESSSGSSRRLAARSARCGSTWALLGRR
ncbi:hypothetical protein B0H13DRAFT_2336721 [Mycena leptocephala]|nr:hypothetical protein B0H13DRAFT_2336721 [Mycena leptocephala]